MAVEQPVGDGDGEERRPQQKRIPPPPTAANRTREVHDGSPYNAPRGRRRATAHILYHIKRGGGKGIAGVRNCVVTKGGFDRASLSSALRAAVPSPLYSGERVRVRRSTKRQ